MAGLIDIDLNPDERTLRHFGFIALVGFGGIALLAWGEWLIFSFGLGGARPWVAGGAAAVGGLAALLSLVAPRANRGLYVGLTLLTAPIGFVLSYVIMGLLFYGLFAPLGLLFRVIGRDALAQQYDQAAESYWTDPRPQRSRDSYFRQF